MAIQTIGGNLIVNGSFEDTSESETRTHGFSGLGSLPGWVDASGADLDQHSDGRGGIDPTDGSFWLDLDASPANVDVSQTVAGIDAGTEYRLSFDIAQALNLGAGDNTVEVFWGGVSLGLFTPGSSFETISITIVGGAGDGSNALRFLGGGTADNFGVSLDNVELFKIGSLLDDAFTVQESEISGDVDFNISANDLETPVSEVNGSVANLDAAVAGTGGGLFTIGADGSVDFDANGEFEALGNGETATTSVEYGVVTQVQIDKYDLILTQDLSGSFSNDIGNVRAQFSGLFSDLTGGGDDVGFGVASFVDKPINPFGNATSGDYAFQTDQSVSTDEATTQSTLDNLVVRSGSDSPESQLIALQQIALRADDDIGFRDGATRFIVLQTDNTFHQAGDFASAGADDGDTDVTENEDYPTIASVAALLQSANISVIFAVTASQIPTYQALLGNLGVEGTVVELSSNSSNLSAAVQDALSDLTAGVTEVETATVTVTVTGENDGPVAADDAIATDSDATGSVVATANDTDAEGDDLEIASVDTAGLLGLVTIDPDGDTLVYDPNGAFDSLGNGETATETFTYTVTDGNGATDTASVTVVVTGVNSPPVAVDDVATTAQGDAVNVDVLENDSDPDGDTLSVDSVSGAANGAVSINADGTIDYTPDADFFGDEEITYVLSDGNGATDVGTLTITVTQNFAPFIPEPIVFFAPENQTLAANLQAFDVEGDPLTYSIAGGADGALFAIDPVSGQLTFLTAPDFEAPTDANGDNRYDVAIGLSDPFNSVQQTIAVNVTDVADTVNTDPTISGPGQVFLTVVTSGVVADLNAVDVDDDTLIFTLFGEDADQFTFDRATGEVSLLAPLTDPRGSFDGDAIFELDVLVEDGNGGSDTLSLDLLLFTAA